jgi:HSP20 family protein
MLANWDPIRDMVQMRQAMNRFLGDWDARPAGRDHKGTPCYRVPIDAYSTEDAIVIEAAMPGADPDEVDVTFEGDSLTIQAEVRPSEGEGRTYLIRERGYGMLERTLNLNVPVDVDKVEARFSNGVLILTIPKAETVKPRKIAVKSVK